MQQLGFLIDRHGKFIRGSVLENKSSGHITQQSFPSGNAIVKDEVKGYTIFAPSSIEFLKYGVEHNYQDVMGIIAEVQRTRGKPAELDQYLQKMTTARKTDTPGYFASYKDWTDLQQKAKGETVYFYERHPTDANNPENGFCVVHDGKIIYRHVIDALPAK